MRCIIFALTILAVAYAADPTPTPIPIIAQEQEVDIDGSFKSSFQTGNGIQSEQHGVLKHIGTGTNQSDVEEVSGSVSYTAPDGTPIHLDYVANENGFQPHGDHLPVAPVDTNTPPPVPALILRALEYNAAHPEEDFPKKVL